MARFVIPAFLLLSALLSACQPLNQSEPEESAPARPEPAEATVPEEPDTAPEENEQRRRRIADELYEGLRALREDRLMTPPERSAYRHFRRALALDPDNELAREGMQDILERYLELARQAAWQGQFDNAETFVRRAALVDEEHPGLAQTREHIEQERERTHSVRMIPRQALNERSSALVSTLRESAREAVEQDLFVLITVPRDGQGRWIYDQMREAVDGQRLPANIEIGGQPSLRLVRRDS